MSVSGRTLLGVALVAGVGLAGGTDRGGLAFAPSWNAAVAEARALHVPIVVHRHGFY